MVVTIQTKPRKVFITHKGQTHSIREWSEKLGINLETLRRRTRLYAGNTGKMLNPNLKVGCPKGTVSWRKKYPSGTRKEYEAWWGMHHRCSNKRSTGYKNYGARGITVCKEWDKFLNFLRDMGKAKPKTSIDRINNNKGYSKSNCRWATKLQQENNRRSNIKVCFRGKTQTIAEWSRELGINHGTLCHRHKIGLPFDRKLGRWI